jgi:poly(A) polymerase
MDTIFGNMRTDVRIRLVAELAEQFGVEVFLVGGCLRDVAMGRSVHDFDFALSGAYENLPAELASRCGGRFFWLDQERQQSRVVTGKSQNGFTLDFAPIRGKNILDDLLLRDFTVNALALPVTKGLSRYMDPLCGMKDIAARKIRACSESTFDDDPLRLLRAVRLAASLDFALEADTWRQIVKRPQLLAGVAGERIRDELILILGERNVGASLEKLRNSGLLAMVISGEPLCSVQRRIDFAAEAERVLEDCDLLFPYDREKLADHLQRPIEGGVPLLSLLKLAAFLVGDNAAEHIASCADRIRLGTKARAELKVLCDCATSFPSLPEELAGDRTMFRFFRDRAPGGAELVILPLAAGLVDAETAARLVAYYFRAYRADAANLLLSGDQVMELLAIGPGLQLGRILESLRQAESTGRVSTAAEAREFLLKNS